MRYLLDTHVFLWRLLDPPRLSSAQAAALDNVENELFLSPISVWEMMALARKGRVELRPDPLHFTRRALAESPIRMVPFDFEVAMRSECLEGFDNPDPADRFLIATCAVHDLCLVTSDERILALDRIATLR